MSIIKKDMALRLAEIGIRLFPVHYITEKGECSCGKICSSPGKHPLRSGWQRNATADVDKIAAIWSATPDANIGIPTGAINSLLVLDFDEKQGMSAEDTLREFEEAYGTLPETLKVRTGGGGFHFYLRLPEGCHLKNTSSSIAIGLDTRADGGYVVGPSSMHSSGHSYEIAGDDPALNAIAFAPDWLIELLSDPPMPPTSDVRASSEISRRSPPKFLLKLCNEIAYAPPGQQEVTLNRNSYVAGLKVRDGKCSFEDALFALTAGASRMLNEDGKRKWDYPEISQKVSRALASGLRAEARSLTHQLAHFHEENRTPLQIGSETELAGVIANDLEEQYGTVKFDEGRFWVFQKTHWRELEHWELNRFISEYDGISVTGSKKFRLNKQQYAGIRERLCDLLIDRDFFQNPKLGINCLSGLISLKQNGDVEVLPHNPNHCRRDVIESAWSPKDLEKSDMGPLLKKLLSGAFENDADAEEKTQLFEEILGAAGLGNARALPQQLAFIMYGPLAGNGKSQFLAAVRGLCPPTAVCCVPVDKMSDERFICQLVGKSVNVVDELSGARGASSDTFKAIITGEMVTGRDVYKSAVTFAPIAVHVFATNDLPTFNGGFDNGVIRRLRLLVFDRKIPADEIVPDIGAKIIESELRHLLTMAVRGAQRVLRNGRFTLPGSSGEGLQDWALGADSVRGWFKDKVELAPGFSTPVSKLYADYRSYCEAEGYTPVGGNKFSRRVITVGNGDVVRERKAHERYLVGIRLIESGSYPASYK